MVLHELSARRDRTSDGQTVLYSYQFDKLFHHVSCGGTHSANSQPFGDTEENRMDKGKKVIKTLGLVRMQPFVSEKKRFL